MGPQNFRCAKGLLAVACSLVLGNVQASYAQEITATLFGTVRDHSGAIIPGAGVAITNAATAATARTTTNRSGEYSVSLLPVGNYSISASTAGFKTETVSKIALTVGSEVRVDVTLEVGSVSEVVYVQSETAQLETATAAVGNTVSQELIENLPVPGRDLLTLALLSPTVVQRGTLNVSALRAPYLGTNIPTISGGRGEAVSFTVGGLNINNRLYNTPMEKPPLDSLAEFTVISNDYSAEYGQGDGQIIAELRSGSNSFHGSLYEFDKNTVLNAREFLADSRDPLVYNQFGGTIGGPVMLPKYNGRNRTFFFTNYEGTRSDSFSTASGLFPTQAMLSGDFSDYRNSDGSLATIYDPLTSNSVTGTRTPFPGNIIPADRISPIAAKLLAAAGTPIASSYQLPFDVQGHVPNNLNVDQFQVKFDENIREADTLSTRYSFSNPYVFTGNLVENAQNTESLRDQLVGQTWTHSFSPTLINEFRAGYTRQRDLNVPPVAASHDLQAAAGITNPIPYNLLPRVAFDSVTGTPSFSDTPPIVAGGNGQIQQQFQFVDNLSWVKGTHSFKVGVDLRRRRWDTVGFVPSASATLGTNGAFTSQLTYNPLAGNALAGGFVPVQGSGSSLADLLLGDVNEEDYGLGNDQFSFRDDMFSWFAQDTWRANRRLTVTYGLRWDYQSPISEKNGRESWFVTSPCPTPGGCLLTDGQVKGLPYDPIINPYPGQDKIRNGGQTPDTNNYGPRLSIAYLLGHNTVVRAGGGIFYSIFEQYQLPGLPTQPPFGTGYQIRTSSTILTSSDYQLEQVWTPLAQTTQGLTEPGVVSLNQIPLTNNVTPRLTDVSVAVQHQFSPSMTMEIGYAGKWGTHLANFQQINYCTLPVNQPCQINPTTGQPIRVYSNFGPIYAQTTNGTNNYQSGYIRFDRRFSSGFSFGSNFTWSKDISTGFDSVSNDIFQGGDDIRDLDDPRLANRKLSLLNVPFRFVAYGVYDLPFGRGRMFASSASRWTDALIGGWQASWVVSMQSGMTTDLSSFGAAYFVSAQAEQELKRLDFRTTGYFFNPALFTLTPTPYPVPPNSFEGAGINNWDLSFAKSFKITERQRLEFRGDFYNAFNHGQFEMPENQIFASGFGQFLLQTSGIEGNSIRPPRNIQLGVHYSF